MNPEPEILYETLYRSLESLYSLKSFQFSEDCFVRETDSVLQRISPSLVHAQSNNPYHLDFYLSVKILEIEKFLQKYRTTNIERWTVSKKMINLCPKKELYSWYFVHPKDITATIPDIETRLVSLALPFLEIFSSAENLAVRIEETIGNWRALIPTPASVDRGEILLAIYLLRNDFDKFKKYAPIMRRELEKENGGYYLDTYDKIVANMARDYKIIF